MNVSGKNERSWRKARKRGVSPIIATILLVAITVVLAAVLYVLISGLTGGGVGSKPIGSAFNAGNPTSASKCTGAGAPVVGCIAANDYVYQLTIESSTVTFGSVLFEVKTTTGSIYAATTDGGFFLNTISSVTVASYTPATPFALAMPSTGFTYSGAANGCGTGVTCSGSSSLTNLFTIVIDMGSVSPTGQGYTFVVIGTGSYSGTTSPLGLP